MVWMKFTTSHKTPVLINMDKAEAIADEGEIDGVNYLYINGYRVKGDINELALKLSAIEIS